MHIRIVAALSIAAVVVMNGSQSSPVNRPWPPGVQPVPRDSPPLAPEDAVGTFYMPPGYRVELVASEPLVQDPIAIDWDLEGRLWVVEMPGYMRDIAASDEHAPTGRVVVLQDQNGDGRMDERTLFADGLILPRAVKLLDAGVLVGEPPNAWLMRDTDGDLRVDTKELVTDRYGRREADPQNNANGFYWALDNRMHTAASDIQLRRRNGRFELLTTLRRGQWGVAQDDAGRIYRNTNESALHVDLVPTPYFARNPNLLRTRGSHERLADANDLNTVWPVRPTPGTNRMYQAGIGRSDGTLARFTAVCAPLIYRGHRLPPDLHGNAFVAEPAAHLVSRIALRDEGSALRARKVYERGEFLASTDERFRPVFLSDAPDGTLYVVDMYRGILEHRISLTEYLRDHIVAHGLETPAGFGRIYRVVHETTERDSAQALARASTAALVELLSHPSGWWRDTAQRLLVERGSRSVTAELVTLAREAPDWRTRLHALWTLDGLDTIGTDTVRAALDDPSRDVRAAAIRLAERWMMDAQHPLQEAVLRRMDDRDRVVRHQLAATLGMLPPASGEPALATLLEGHGDDPVTLDAALSGIRGREASLLATLAARAEARTPQREAAMTMLAATVMRAAQDASARTVLGWVADANRPQWVRASMLQGVEVALLGAPLPGTPPPLPPPVTGPAAPCATCPGGRAGPGGAYAFPRPPVTSPASGRGAAGLRLNTEPSAFAALASGKGDVEQRAARVLARVTWPGKPGEPAPMAPLNPEGRRRFAEGAEVYKDLCQGCHQPDGRGEDRLAPSLIESPLVLADSEIGVRILLHGKEGPVGLMPPVGGVLSDARIAAVLTYIRREWGHGGSPVDPSLVQQVRQATAQRTRPWTDAEIKALVK